MRSISTLLFILVSFNTYSLTRHIEIEEMDTMLKDLKRIVLAGHKPARTLIVFDIDHTLINLIQGKKLKASGLTEKKIPFMIKNLQNNKFRVMALTARPNIFHNFTKTQLNYYSIDFNRRKIGSDWIRSRRIKGFKRLVSYKDGIMMASGQHKGRLLEYLIRNQYKGKIPFTQIVFVDDGIRNTTGVFNVFNELGIEVAAYTYKR